MNSVMVTDGGKIAGTTLQQPTLTQCLCLYRRELYLFTQNLEKQFAKSGSSTKRYLVMATAITTIDIEKAWWNGLTGEKMVKEFSAVNVGHSQMTGVGSFVKTNDCMVRHQIRCWPQYVVSNYRYSWNMANCLHSLCSTPHHSAS